MARQLHSSAFVDLNPDKTAVKIFRELFTVRIPEMYVYTLDEINHFGVFQSGEPVVDNAFSHNTRLVKLPIAKIATLYYRGCDVSIVNPDDTTLIYEYVQEHLLAWHNLLDNDMANTGGAPIDDLLLLEDFANATFEYAKYHYTPKPKVLNTKRVTMTPNYFMISDPKNTGYFRDKWEEYAKHNTRDKWGLTEGKRKVPTRRSLSDVFINHSGTNINQRT